MGWLPKGRCNGQENTQPQPAAKDPGCQSGDHGMALVLGPLGGVGVCVPQPETDCHPSRPGRSLSSYSCSNGWYPGL